MTIRWITNLLGTAPALSQHISADMQVIDVRDLVDKDGNSADAVRKKIVEGCKLLSNGKKTIISCDYGISRSNAIAVGVLALHESITYEEAVRKVLKATDEKEIKVGPLQVVRRALEEESKIRKLSPPSMLITGSTGFLGKSLTQKFLNNVDVNVIGLSSANLDLTGGTTELELIVSENNVKSIIHLANPRVYTSNVAMGMTLTMLRNVIDVCVAHNLRLIYLSSWEVYTGYRSSELFANESLPLLPKGPYAETKYLAEILIENARRMQGLNCAIVRSSPVFGLDSDKPKFIYNFIDKIKRGEKIITHCYRNGKPALDLLYVDDLISAVYKLVQTEFNGNLNIGTGKVTTTYRIAELLQKLLAIKVDIEQTYIQSDMASIAMDATKATEILGWKPTVNLEQGLEIILGETKV